MQRYFAQLHHDLVILTDDDLFHLRTVMRAEKGEEIEVVINNNLYLAKIFSLNPVEIKVIKELEDSSEISQHITLMVAPLKGQKTELVLQKAAELGVKEIILVLTSRTISRFKKEEAKHKLARYQKIIKEASEQAKRTIVPEISYYDNFEEALMLKADLKLIANEKIFGPTNCFNDCLLNLKAKEKITILIGPEGGFSDEEVIRAEKYDFLSVSLGKRILRAETAAFYALSVIANNLEYK